MTETMPYRDKLDADAKARYQQKIDQLDGLDPYEHTEWISVKQSHPQNFDLLPHLTEVNIFQYLVHGTSFCTMDEFNNRKALDCHNRFTVGFVGDLRMYTVNSTSSFEQRYV